MAKIEPIPEHLHTVTPRLIVGMEQTPSSSMFAALKRRSSESESRPQGEVISREVSIGDSVVMIMKALSSGQSRCVTRGLVTAIMAPTGKTLTKPGTARLAPALKLSSIGRPFYGERGGRLRDPFGQQWMLSQRI